MTDQEMNAHQQIGLLISEDVERLVADRMIGREDLQKVIYRAESTAKKLINLSTGRSLAYFRPKAVFYWVEYSQCDDGYQVHTAYSHRMVTKSSGSSKEWVKTGTETDWLCNPCQRPLEVQTVRLQYMQSIFPIDLPACSGCDFVLVAEDLATGKMAEAEQALEDK